MNTTEQSEHTALHTADTKHIPAKGIIVTRAKTIPTSAVLQSLMSFSVAAYHLENKQIIIIIIKSLNYSIGGEGGCPT